MVIWKYSQWQHRLPLGRNLETKTKRYWVSLKMWDIPNLDNALCIFFGFRKISSFVTIYIKENYFQNSSQMFGDAWSVLTFSLLFFAETLFVSTARKSKACQIEFCTESNIFFLLWQSLVDTRKLICCNLYFSPLFQFFFFSWRTELTYMSWQDF